MKLNYLLTVGVATLMISSGVMAFVPKDFTEKTEISSVNISEAQVKQLENKIIAKEAEELTTEELKKLDLQDFNMPSKNFTAYQAKDVEINNKGIVITANDYGFSLKKGDIVRVNSVNNENDSQYYSVGYVKNGEYTSTSVGKMNEPLTAWEVLDNKDAGLYEILIKSESTTSKEFDVIVTIEREL